METIKYELYDRLKITPRFSKSKLQVDEIYQINGHIIPKGFITNGADIPRILWPLRPPNYTPVLPAVILHDMLIDKVKYNYDNGEFIESKDLYLAYKKADLEFKRALNVLPIKRIEKRLYFGAVAFYTLTIRRIESWVFFKRKKKFNRKQNHKLY